MNFDAAIRKADRALADGYIDRYWVVRNVYGHRVIYCEADEEESVFYDEGDWY